MPAKYDNRRFRTLVDMVIPAGTLVLPATADGRANIIAPNDQCGTTASLNLAEAERIGLVRQLAEGEA